MTKERIYELNAEAESGNVESMKKLASFFIEAANQHTDAGRLEQAMLCIKLSNKWKEELKRRNIW